MNAWMSKWGGLDWVGRMASRHLMLNSMTWQIASEPLFTVHAWGTLVYPDPLPPFHPPVGCDIPHSLKFHSGPVLHSHLCSRTCLLQTCLWGAHSLIVPQKFWHRCGIMASADWPPHWPPTRPPSLCRDRDGFRTELSLNFHPKTFPATVNTPHASSGFVYSVSERNMHPPDCRDFSWE